MARLYVDCDDTLIRWCTGGCEHGIHPYGADAQNYTFNEDVLAAVERWLTLHPPASVVIWSGGGVDYARTWADRAFPGRSFLVASKWNVHPEPGDIFIDDAPFDAWAGSSVHPRDVNTLFLPS